MCQVSLDTGPYLTVPVETSYTWLKAHNSGKTDPSLLVLRFREDLAWQFSWAVPIKNMVKADLHIPGSKLRWHGERNMMDWDAARAFASG